MGRNFDVDLIEPLSQAHDYVQVDWGADAKRNTAL